MSNLNVTEVRVTFGNGVKKEEYGALKKAEVSLLCVVPDGEDGLVLLDRAAVAAQAKVAEMLGLAAPAVTTPTETGAPSTPRRRRTNAEIAADAAAAEAARKASEAAGTPAEKPADPPKIDDGFDPPADEKPADPPAEAPASEWDAAPAEVSDKDLTDACTKTAQRLAEGGDAAGAVRIRELIGTFNPDPTKKFSLVEIAAAQRPDFLAKLGALTPASK